MIFEPDKSELIYFTKARAASSLRLDIGGATLTPIQSGRFLGVWLDRKLNFKAYLVAVRSKLAT